MEFNKIELDVAKEIINIGLGRAADSMAFFTHEKVFIRSLDVEMKSIDKMDSIKELSKKRNNKPFYVLSTEIKGDLKGICYLIFSEEEVNKLLKVSLPEEILNNPDKLKIMGEAILLEMDNIIVASVVTQFSNLFSYAMHGDVPKLKMVDTNKIEEIITEENSFANHFLYFKSEFNTAGLDVNPEFIWLLDDKYYEGVKSIIDNEIGRAHV